MMPEKIVDLSARSSVIRDEPWHLHFWESRPSDILKFLQDPRGVLSSMGITIPEECRIETNIENHDWISTNTDNFRSDGGGVVVCNVGGGNVAKSYYRVSMYGHREEEVAKFSKQLLHDPQEEGLSL